MKADKAETGLEREIWAIPAADIKELRQAAACAAYAADCREAKLTEKVKRLRAVADAGDRLSRCFKLFDDNAAEMSEPAQEIYADMMQTIDPYLDDLRAALEKSAVTDQHQMIGELNKKNEG